MRRRQRIAQITNMSANNISVGKKKNAVTTNPMAPLYMEERPAKRMKNMNSMQPAMIAMMGQLFHGDVIKRVETKKSVPKGGEADVIREPVAPDLKIYPLGRERAALKELNL